MPTHSVRLATKAFRPGAARTYGGYYRKAQKPYEIETCRVCGEKVAANWYVRHIKSRCMVGTKPKPCGAALPCYACPEPGCKDRLTGRKKR